MTGYAADSRRELLRWILSAAIVVALHGGFAAAMVHWRDVSEPDDPASAIVIDLAPMPVAPPSTPHDLPPGPEQIQADAAPQKPVEEVEEEKVEKEVETKEVQEVQPELEQAEKPEVVLDAQQPKPEQERPRPADNLPPAPATTAPQVTEAQTGAVAAAPSQGRPNMTNSNAVPTWKRQVVGLLERNKRYPAAAQSRGEHGTAYLAFSLDRKGRVTTSRIVRSSGSAALDQETLELVRRAQPFPPPPDEIAGAQIDLSVPIRFNIR